MLKSRIQILGPESRGWDPESTLVWNPESRRLQSGIQRARIQNPYAGIWNPGPSWISYMGRTTGRVLVKVKYYKSTLMRFHLKRIFFDAVSPFVHTKTMKRLIAFTENGGFWKRFLKWRVFEHALKKMRSVDE